MKKTLSVLRASMRTKGLEPSHLLIEQNDTFFDLVSPDSFLDGVTGKTIL
ncbi:hypothetical protein [Abyssalbus ytuae]|uniref:Uncharacterized protein n=1 Tax=Abyssalbus ytuae TaxID=2926907 RepID=A0A9E6ZQG6_9FLAO|nr:hypothetical protein [Abyssalbus ytuae]UOB19054.1 hypothetical protein MQE35_07085 [Abyssalbus ytuae]